MIANFVCNDIYFEKNKKIVNVIHSFFQPLNRLKKKKKKNVV